MWVVSVAACGAAAGGGRPQAGSGALAGSGAQAGVLGNVAGTTFAGSGGAGVAGAFGTAGATAGIEANGCTIEQMAAACVGVQCGPAASCGAQCGDCTGDDTCVAGACVPPKCGRLELTIDTYAACAVNITDTTELDGEAFIQAGGMPQRVLAMDRWGQGHIMAWCDASSLGSLITSVNARGYLGRSQTARVASFGDDFMCNPNSPSAYPVPEWITYFGLALPAEYLGDPAKLRADWDAIVYCGFRHEWNDGWTSLLQSYVSEHGGGLLAVLDYAGIDLTHDDFVHMGGITAPSGIGFDEVVLEHATATANVVDECVPDYQPGPE
jgi:hypothetical protein